MASMAHFTAPSDNDMAKAHAAGDLDALSSGQAFGERYRLTALLDRGSTSAVWRADDLRTGKPCVLKLFAGLEESQATALRQDLEAARGIEHPGLCGILDVGQHGGLVYQASELVVGESLKERLAGDGFGVDLGFLVLHQVAAALDAAHQRGLWHGRLSPAQVMLQAYDRVVVLGLGQRRCDAPGQTLPAYAPPERASGRGLGPQSDVYGLGLLICHMLTGQAELAQPLGTPLHVLGLSTGGQRLEAILGRALDPEPARRFPSVTALSEAVTAVLFARDEASASAAPEGAPGELTSDAALAATDLAGAGTSGASPAQDAAFVAQGPMRLKRGDSLGRYLILDILGQGGMGAVYSAYDPELDRRVALKLLHTAASSSNARKRLVREARALASTCGQAAGRSLIGAGRNGLTSGGRSLKSRAWTTTRPAHRKQRPPGIASAAARPLAAM
jgi:serine/threonine protein kinase